MTLSEVLPVVSQLSVEDKQKLLNFLTQELADIEDITPIEPGRTYDLPTPYGNFGAGATMMQALGLGD